jgi:hypothetical protein
MPIGYYKGSVILQVSLDSSLAIGGYEIGYACSLKENNAWDRFTQARETLEENFDVERQKFVVVGVVYDIIFHCLIKATEDARNQLSETFMKLQVIITQIQLEMTFEVPRNSQLSEWVGEFRILNFVHTVPSPSWSASPS